MTKTTKLQEALPAWITARAKSGQIRGSTASRYRGRLKRWVYAHPLPDGRVLGLSF